MTLPLTQQDRALVRALGQGLPLVPRPFAVLAERLGRSEADVLARLREWRQSGILRRLSAYVRHRREGYQANGMVVWDVADGAIAAAGARLAASPKVSHCYARVRTESFPYRLYAMVHGRTRDEVQAEAARLSCEAGLGEFRILFSTRELKRSDPPLFAEEEGL